MKRLLLVLWVVLVSVASAEVCSYERFTPTFLKAQLQFQLGELQIGETEGAIGETLLVRDGGVIGTVQYQNDFQNHVSHLTVFDNKGWEIFNVVAEAKGVSRREITIESGFEKFPQLSSLLILNFNAGGVFHYVGVQDKGITAFYSEFSRFWNQMVTYLVRETIPNRPIFETPAAGFRFDARSIPDLAPYANLFSVVLNRGQYEIVGSVPSNYIYGLVVRLAQKHFGYGVRPRLTINGFLQQPPAQAPRCGWQGHD